MKKWLFWLVAVVMLFSLTACNNNSAESESLPSKTTETFIETTTSTSKTTKTFIETTTSTSKTTETFIETATSTSKTTETFTKSTTSTSRSTSETSGTQKPAEDMDIINLMREDYNLGNCRQLSGNVTGVLLYMDDFESCWTQDEVAEFTESEVKPALDFVEKQARNYNVSLSMEIGYVHFGLYYDDEVVESIRETGYATGDVLWKASRELGYASDLQMLDEYREQFQTEEIVCFTIFNKDGTSYALNPKRGYEDHNVREHCIIFAYDRGSNKENAIVGGQSSVIAHEMLHLFGAEDFYTPLNRKEMAEKKFPNDIMLHQEYQILGNNIGAATAFYIGWTDTVPEVLYDRNW